MKITSRTMCSLFAAIAVVLMIGTAFAGILSEIDATDSHLESNAEKPYAVFGVGSSSTFYEEYDDLLAASLAAESKLEKYSNVKVIVQMDTTYDDPEFRAILRPGIGFVVNKDVTFTLNSQLRVESGIVDVKGKMVIEKPEKSEIIVGLAIEGRNSLCVKDGGSIEILNGAGIFINYCTDTSAWIGYNNVCSLVRSDSAQSKITVTTVGDTVSGLEFGIVIEVDDQANYLAYTDVDSEFGAKERTTLQEFDKLIMKRFDKSIFYRLTVKEGAQVFVGDTPIVGKDALSGNATVNRYTTGETIVVTSDKMTVPSGQTAKLDSPLVKYEVGTLVVDGTLILNKKIDIVSSVVVSGNLVLANRDYLCPKGESISVELEGDGLITLSNSNKWYGKGAVLNPDSVSDVKLTIVKLSDGTTSYQFEIKGFVCIKYVDTLSFFDIRAKDMITVSQGFLVVDGYVHMSDFVTGGDLPIKTEGMGGIAFTHRAVVYYDENGRKYIFANETYVPEVVTCIELADKELTEKQIAVIGEVIGDSEITKRIREISVGSLFIARSNSAGGLNVNVAGTISTTWLPIGSNDVYKVVGTMHVKPIYGDTIVYDGGKLDVDGAVIVEGGLIVRNNATFNVSGIMRFTGHYSEFVLKGQEIVGPNNNFIYSISNKASLTTISTSKWRIMIATVEDGATDFGVRVNKQVDLENTCFIVGYDHVKITKEMGYLGLTEDDISALDVALGLHEVEIKEKSGKVKVIDGGAINDTTGYGFLLVGGDASFEHGSKYTSNGKTIVDSEGDAVFKLLETGSNVVISNHLISEKLLEELKAKNPGTEYANILFGKSYTLNGKIKITGLTVKYNEKIVYKEENTLGGFLIFGEAWADGTAFIGHDGTFQFELASTSSMMAVDHAESSKAVAIGGKVILHRDFTVDEKTQLIIRSEKKPYSTTILAVNDKAQLSISRKHLVIEGATESEPLISLTQDTTLIIDGKLFVGKTDTGAPVTIGEDARIDLKINAKGGVDMHTYGLVTINGEETFVVDEKDTLTVTNYPEQKSLTVKGTLIVVKKENFAIDGGEVYLAPSATVKIGFGDDNIIFGKDANAMFTIGDDSYLLVSNNLFDGAGIKVFGKSTENSTLTLNEGKTFTVSDKGYLILVDSKLLVDEKAIFNATKRGSVATVVTEEFRNDDYTPSIVGVGGDNACFIDISGFIDFNTFENKKRVGFFGEQIIITAKELSVITGEESTEEILKNGAIDKAVISGDVSRGKGYTIQANDLIETVAGTDSSSLKINANLVVKGELVVKSTSLTLGIVKTEDDGKITVFGNESSSIMVNEKQIVGKGTVEGPFLFGADTKVEVKTSANGGFDAILKSGTVTMRDEFCLDANDSITVETGGKLMLNAKLTVVGKLRIGDGTLIADKGEYLELVEYSGSLVLLKGSVVAVDGIPLFGPKATLDVETESVTFKVDYTGLVMVIGGEIKVNEGAEFTFPEFRVVFDKWARINLEKNSAIVFKSGSEIPFEFDSGAYFEFKIGARMIIGNDEHIGPNGVTFKTSGDGGVFSICVTSRISWWYQGLTMRLMDELNNDSDAVGITVEFMPKEVTFTSLFPVEVDRHCKLVFGDDMNIKVTGDKFDILGQLVIGNSKLICDGRKLKFENGSSFYYNGKCFVGEEGINLTIGGARIEIGFDEIETLGGKIRINVDIYNCAEIKEGVTITTGNLPTGEEYVLSLKEEKTHLDVHGTLEADMKYTHLYSETVLNFFEGSSFTFIDDSGEHKMIGTGGSIALTLPGGLFDSGKLVLTPNTKSGYDISLNGDIEATIQNEFAIGSKDTFTVGESAKLIVKEKMTVGCKTLVVNGLLRFDGGSIDLADGSMIKLVYGSTLMFDETVLMGDPDNEDAIVTMMGEGGIFMSKNGQGWKYDVKSEIRINDKDGGFVIDSKDVFEIENNVTILGMVTIHSLDQITLLPGKTISLISVSEDEKYVFHAGLTIEGKGIFVAADGNAIINVTGDNSKFVFTKTDKGMKIDFANGEAYLTKDLTISENSEFIIGKSSKLNILDNVTLTTLGRCVLNGGELIVNGEIDLAKGTLFIASDSTLTHRGTPIIGNGPGAWVNIKSTSTADGFIALDNIDKRFVCNGLVTLNVDITVPEGYTLCLDDCQMEVFGSLEFIGEMKMEFNSVSSMSFFVGSQLFETIANNKHVIIGTDDENADCSMSGVRSLTSRYVIAVNTELGVSSGNIMSGVEEDFTLTVYNAYVIDEGCTLAVGPNAKLIVKNDLTLKGSITVDGDMVIEEGVAFNVVVGGSIHITFTATVFEGSEEVIGHSFDEVRGIAILEMRDPTTKIDMVKMDNGIDMTMTGHVIVNDKKTLHLANASTLTVSGKLDIDGELTVDNPNGMKAIPFGPDSQTTAIVLGKDSTVKAFVNGAIMLEGSINDNSSFGVKGNVTLSGDLVLNGKLNIDGNFMLMTYDISGKSTSAFVKGAIVLNGTDSRQLERFDGTIRVHQYYDGPMLYIANGKVNNKWNIDLEITYGPGVEEQPVPFVTKDNTFDGSAVIMITLAKYQKVTLTIIGGAGEIVQVSEGVWYVYSYDFDMKISVQIEDVGPSGDYALSIYEVVNELKQPGFEAILAAKTAQYVNEGTFTIHYTLKHLTSEGIWVYSISGFSAGVEDWIMPITLENKVSSVTFGGVLEESKYIPVGSYLVSGYATYETVLGGRTVYWSSPTIISMSNVPVPHIEKSIDEAYAMIGRTNYI